MKLHLKNFCCWEDKIFEFPDDGNVLISAPSGEGKTSIIRAILFALFGQGQKIVQFGKRSCSVELTLNDLHILRSKGPGRLVVNQVAEDEEGQHIIDGIFSNRMFYLEQGNANSFVLMSPNDKLEYLEQIIFNKIDMPSIKSKIKLVIHECENKLMLTKRELGVIEKVLLETVVEKETSPPAEMYTIEDYEKVQKSIQYAKHVGASRMELSNRIDNLNVAIESKRELITENSNELETIRRQYGQLDDVEKMLETAQSQYRYVANLRKYEKCQKEYTHQRGIYDTLVKTERDDLEGRIEKMEQQLEDNSPDAVKMRIDELNHSIMNHHESQKVMDELRSLVEPVRTVSEDEYTKSTHTLRDLNSTYQCPSCNVALRMHNNILTDIGVPREDIEYISQRIETYITERDAFKEYESRVNYLKRKQNSIPASECTLEEMMASIKDCETSYKALVASNGMLDALYLQLDVVVEKYESMKSNLAQLNAQCFKLKKLVDSSIETNMDEADISALVEQLQKKSGLQEHCAAQMKQLVSKGVGLDAALADLVKEKLSAEKSLSHVPRTEDVETLELRRCCIQKSLDVARKYDAYYKSKCLYEKYEAQRDALNLTISTTERELTDALKFKEKIAEAESIALTNLVQTINTNVQAYLDGFFENEPMVAVLSCYKTVKKSTKPQVNISIEHKGNQVEVQTLSGGERDRVILAFTLTMAEMCSSQLIILDECISSLDQENSDNVFRCIKSQCKNRLTILVAHQIVTGIFDTVIEL